MAKFCSEECEEAGSICDFCKHYKDEYPVIITAVTYAGIWGMYGLKLSLNTLRINYNVIMSNKAPEEPVSQLPTK